MNPNRVGPGTKYDHYFYDSETNERIYIDPHTEGYIHNTHFHWWSGQVASTCQGQPDMIGNPNVSCKHANGSGKLGLLSFLHIKHDVLVLFFQHFQGQPLDHISQSPTESLGLAGKHSECW